MTAPRVSVVVPTEGRAHLVRELLQSLEVARARSSVETEVLIVDSSTGAVASAIREDCGRLGAFYVPGTRSVREKRNEGASRARGEIILFVDSDCAVDADLLTRHAAAYDAEPEIAGVVGVTTFVGAENLVTRVAELSPFTEAFRFARQMPYAAWGTTSNLSVRREVFVRFNGFETTFPFRLGGDDLDFTWRITREGCLLRCVPDAIVYHSRETWSNARSLLSRVWRWGRMEAHLRVRHNARLAAAAPGALFWMILGALAAVAVRPVDPRAAAEALAAFVVAAAVLEAAALISGLRHRRVRDVSIMPLVSALGLVYRAAMWREALTRRLAVRPFMKMYFDSGHLRGEAAERALVYWRILVAALVAMGVAGR